MNIQPNEPENRFVAKELPFGLKNGQNEAT